MEFKDRLMELRKYNGWSQEELSDRVEVSRQTVSKWELGQSTPEMNKLVTLSDLFGISLDEFIAGKELKSNKEVIYIEQKRHYEYKSKLSVNGLPLVHINFGYGLYRAKGIIAIGNIAIGIIAMGIISLGLISIGVIALGILALAGISMGIISAGGLSIGVFAVGGLAIGYLSIGGLDVGKSIKGTVGFIIKNSFKGNKK